MGRLQKGVNDLKTWCLNNGDFGKQLISEWTGECEDNQHYKIDEVARASNRKFKWKCSKGHEWLATVNARTSSKSGCPYCSKERQSEIITKARLFEKNSLKTWCESNGAFGEQLISEWTGECKNGRYYGINEVSFGSSKKFKWVCSKGHEWFSTVSHRTIGRSCPHCHNANRGKIVSKAKLSNENSLKTWCLNNGSFGEQLIQEWTGECDDGTHYNIDQVSRASHKKFKWICGKGHEWSAEIASRAYNKQGCPYCSGNRVSDENSLKTWCLNHNSFGKQLMTEWTGESIEGTQCGIDEVTRGSKKKFKWKCSKGHEWFTKVIDRTSNKSGCPYCHNANRGEIASKAKLSNENSLQTWCLNNGSWGQQLIQEWTGECEDGKRYTIDEVSYGSHNKKFKWKCSKGHEWFTTVNPRTKNKTGCPYCNNIGTSYPEQFIYHSLKQIFPNTENRCKVLKSPQNPQGIEFDVGVPEIPLCIEYSPTYWHEGREERDQYKKDICQKANVRLIQIVEDSYDELSFKMEPNYICFKMNYSQQDEILEVIVDHILKSLGHSISEINIELVKQKAYESSKGTEKEIQDIE